MKAIALIKKSTAQESFQQIDVPRPVPNPGEVLIKVHSSGLNFADVMARQGLYKDAPPLPAVLGYDVAGIVEAVGAGVSQFKPGQQVAALTRFGGYAEYAISKEAAMMALPANCSFAQGTALATQYCTAYYASAVVTNLYPGEVVLVHSAAGGVGTALVQYALMKGCTVVGTASTEEKLLRLLEKGVHFPSNLHQPDFETWVQQITEGKGIDVIFDAVGGASVKKGMRLLAAGGRLVCYGAASFTNQSILGKIKSALAFGWYHPISLMGASKSLLGINMLHIGDQRPGILTRCMHAVAKLANEGIFVPEVGATFKASEVGKAHALLESGKSQGKIVLEW